MSTSGATNLQDPYLNDLRKRRMSVVIYLVNGIRLTGVVDSFDQHAVLLRQGTDVQLIYKHTIASMMLASKAATDRKPRPPSDNAASGDRRATVPVIVRKASNKVIKRDLEQSLAATMSWRRKRPALHFATPAKLHKLFLRGA